VSREHALAALDEALAGFGNTSSPLADAQILHTVGAVARVAHGDDHDLAARADDALARVRSAAFRLDTASLTSFCDGLALAPTSANGAVDHDATSVFARLVSATTVLAGAQALDFAHPTLVALRDRTIAATQRRIHEAPTAPRPVALALLATAHIADHGVFPGPDDALLALADGLGPVLQAAFRGEPIEPLLGAPGATPRHRALAPDELLRLGRILATALERSLDAPLTIASELLELTPFFLASSAPELVLHEAASGDTHDEPILASEPLPGVLLRARLDVLEIELTAAAATTGAYPEPLLLPLVGDAALAPCRCRAGQHDGTFVFEPSEHPAVDAYALLVGDQIAILRA
jgi:hypothetical protein